MLLDIQYWLEENLAGFRAPHAWDTPSWTSQPHGELRKLVNKAQLRWQEKGETVDVRPGYSNCHDDEDDADDADDAEEEEEEEEKEEEEEEEVMGVPDVVKCGHFS